VTSAQDVCAVAFDAIREHAHYIPRDAFAVGGYINGAVTRYIWTGAEWGMFAHSYRMRINVTGEPGRGNVLDVERGDASPGHVAPWIRSRAPVTEDPLIVYCNRSNLAACMAARDSARPHHAWIWCATLDGTITDRAMTQAFQTHAGGIAVTDVSLITSRSLRAAMARRIGHQT
jgi:hypothetical protein